VARGGKQPGAGRPKGVPNKATQKRQAEVAASGPTPLDVMLQDMRFRFEMARTELDKGEKANKALVADYLEEARKAAKDVAPYVHPRLQTVQHGGTEGASPIPIKIESLNNEQLNQLIARIESALSAS